MTDERGIIRGRENNNSSSYDESENSKREISENGRCEDRLPNILTHSLTLSQIPSLTIIIILHYICNLDNHNFDDDH